MKYSINIIIPTIIFGITTLGLAAILHGGLVDIQLGANTIKVVGSGRDKVP